MCFYSLLMYIYYIFALTLPFWMIIYLINWLMFPRRVLFAQLLLTGTYICCTKMPLGYDSLCCLVLIKRRVLCLLGLLMYEHKCKKFCWFIHWAHLFFPFSLVLLFPFNLNSGSNKFRELLFLHHQCIRFSFITTWCSSCL